MLLSRKIIVLVLLGLFTAPLAFGQSEALKVVVNNLAYYRQRGELKYLSNAKKSVDSLIKTRSDSSNLGKNIYKAIVYSSIAYIDSTNRLNQPADFSNKTVELVDRLSHHKRIYKYQTELDFSKRCLANVLIRNGFEQCRHLDFTNAVESFKKAQQYSPKFGQINAYIAYANTRAGRLEEAVKFYNTLLTADSAKTEYVIAASNIYKTMGDTAKALETLQKGRRFLPGDKSLVLEEANIFNNKKDYRSLEPLLKDLLDAYGNDAEVYFIAANCYDRLEKYDRAESLYLRAIELNSAAYDPVLNLGLLYLKLSAAKRNKDEADKNLSRSALWLQKAYEMSPKNVNTLKLLQLIYAKSGNDTQLNNINSKLQQLTN
ncbi:MULTISPECIES: tetratricopeptide repeat protein [unclassified Mucilaginibacter]|uniref:tetratricopeptide repeat protein n=1 Tax=unclassified Mucilaginibacter TaxID=2617802 RepID=UPI0031F655F5